MPCRAGRPTLAQALLLYGLLVGVALTTVVPLFWMLSTSLKLPDVPATAFLPGDPTLANYAKVLRATPFGRYYVNSLVVSLLVTVGQVASSALAAFAFARLRFPGRDRLFLAYLATMMIPQAVTMIPLFMLLTRTPLNLNDWLGTRFFTDELFFLGRYDAGRVLGSDSYFVLVAPLLFSPYGTFLLRQFFITVPRELDEAAALDGCSKWQLLSEIHLPLSTPALATLATFTFMSSWGNFLWPLIMTNTETMRPLPVGLASFMGEYQTDWPLMMAGAVMTLLPMILVFVACQRYFVRGIQTGAVKG